MQIQLQSTDIQSAIFTAATNALATEAALGADAQAQLTTLVNEMLPLVIAETQSLMTDVDPVVAQQYLAVISGTVDAKIATLGLSALAAQKQQIAVGITTGVQIMAVILKAAIPAVAAA